MSYACTLAAIVLEDTEGRNDLACAFLSSLDSSLCSMPRNAAQQVLVDPARRGCPNGPEINIQVINLELYQASAAACLGFVLTFIPALSRTETAAPPEHGLLGNSVLFFLHKRVQAGSKLPLRQAEFTQDHSSKSQLEMAATAPERSSQLVPAYRLLGAAVGTAEGLMNCTKAELACCRHAAGEHAHATLEELQQLVEERGALLLEQGYTTAGACAGAPCSPHTCSPSCCQQSQACHLDGPAA